jgi:KUP system potassium uptake protein
MSRTDSRPVAVTMVAALGVVFGDIGTSPLYAMKTMLHDAGSIDRTAVYGVTSLVIWTLVLIVSVLFVGVLLRADNEGEGGPLALVALVRRSTTSARVAVFASIAGMAGAAMFLGDSVITPAISVLSAAEGLEVASPSLKVLVLPIAAVLLIGVFVLQRIGSGKIGKVYGPVMVVWFAVLAAGGIGSLVQSPEALQALSPTWGARFVLQDPLTGFLTLGAVILAVTGAEALYADLGHFGRSAIARAWMLLVLPALVLAYLGEAGAILRDGRAAAVDPFYSVVPDWATIPVLVTATMATVIASEAVIAGAFTLLHQAGGMGFFPYLRTEHTSRTEAGQIYLPAANWAIAAAVLIIVGLFRDSARLSAAYGIAVSVTFLVTVVLYLLLRQVQNPGSKRRLLLPGFFLLVVLIFFAATVPKVVSGGWVPLAIGFVLFVVMTTWWSGRRRLHRSAAEQENDPEEVLAELTAHHDGPRLEGTAVFLTQRKDIAPIALCTVVEFGYPLTEQVLLMSWHVEDTPGAPADRTSVSVETFDGRFEGIRAVEVTLGYRERLDIQQVLKAACEAAPDDLGAIDAETARFFVSDPIPRLDPHNGIAMWRQRLFLLIDRLSTDRVDQLKLPRDRTIVIGRELDL